EAYRPGGNPQAIKHKVILGLDLQGGMYLDVEVQTEAAVTRLLDQFAVDLEDSLLEELVDYLVVERKGNAVEVSLAEGEKVKWNEPPFRRILNTMVLEQVSPTLFRLEFPPQEVERIKRGSVDQALEVIRNRIDSLGVSEPSIQRQGETSILIQLPGLKDRDSAINAIGTQAVLEFYMVVDNVTMATMDPSRHVVKFLERRDPTTKKLTGREPYVLEKRPAMSGETIRDARVTISPQDNTPRVSLSFDSLGSDRFARITSRNRGRRLAIVLDNKVQSAPVIREAITDGEAVISGQFTMDEASNLAIVLRSGALPAPIQIREERTVGATLGADSIRQGIMSLLIGAMLVVLFMIAYYRVAGVFAILALTFNLLIILAVLAAFQATLTLPGIAGMVLTLGMAVDANVLIFERIREELRRTENVRQSVNEGFQKAFWTIFDANLTTLFGAFALLAFGTGPIKGFAVTLTIGILASMFTAIVVTRLLFELFYLRRPHLSEISI
ncbi:MAG: protein translocase subunit SecD, partial [SAR324 cluster bacterium]|nr:protein translocase subunit SecD [SAR324 cluster bacterium]